MTGLHKETAAALILTGFHTSDIVLGEFLTTELCSLKRLCRFGGKSPDSGVQQIRHLLAVWLCRNHFASPCLSFFICKIGIITCTSEGLNNIKYIKPDTVPGSKKEFINGYVHTLLKKRGTTDLLFLLITFPLFVIKYGGELKCTEVNNK